MSLLNWRNYLVYLCLVIALSKATFAKNLHFVLSSAYSKAFIFNLLCVLITKKDKIYEERSHQITRKITSDQFRSDKNMIKTLKHKGKQLCIDNCFQLTNKSTTTTALPLWKQNQRICTVNYNTFMHTHYFSTWQNYGIYSSYQQLFNYFYSFLETMVLWQFMSKLVCVTVNLLNQEKILTHSSHWAQVLSMSLWTLIKS